MTTSTPSSESLPPNWIKTDKILRNPELWPFEQEKSLRSFRYMALRWIKTKDEVNKQSVRSFPDYDYLADLDQFFETEDLILVEKSRRMFMTWYCLCRIIWMALRTPNGLFMLQSKKEDDAKDLVRKCIFVVKHLPKEIFFPDGAPQFMAYSIVFPNGAEIRGIPQGEEQLRMHTVTIWFCDEAKTQDKLDEAWMGSGPALEGGGRAWIISSTAPCYFHDLVDDVAGIIENIEEYEPEESDESSYQGFSTAEFGETFSVKERGSSEGTKKKVNNIRKGLTVWKNPGNAFFVIRLHYSADPRKDPDTEEGRKWKRRAQRGQSQSGWNQEYEIDSTALAESLVYNFKPEIHILNAEITDIPGSWPIFHTADVGMAAPTVGLWAVCTPTGDIICVYEYYKRNRTIEENAFAMNSIEEQQGLQPILSKIDPSAFDRMFTGVTTAGEYVTAGRYYGPANNDLKPGIEVVKQYLKNAENGKSPGLYFLPSCKETFKEFRNYRVGNQDKPKKGNDHAMDCIRYLLMMPPFFREVSGTEHVNTFRNKLTGYTTDYEWPEEDEEYDGCND